MRIVVHKLHSCKQELSCILCVWINSISMLEFNKWGEKLKIIAAAPLGTAVFFMFSF